MVWFVFVKFYTLRVQCSEQAVMMRRCSFTGYRVPTNPFADDNTKFMIMLFSTDKDTLPSDANVSIYIGLGHRKTGL